MRRALFVTIGVLAVLAGLPMLAFPAQASSLSMSSLVGFSLSADPPSASLAVGTVTSVTIIVSSQGLNGPVNLGVAISSNSGPTASLSPSTVLVLPGGNANSTLNIDATSAQQGTYNIQVTGSSSLAPSQETTVVTSVTATASNPPVNPPSGSAPPTGTSPPSGSGSTGNSGPGNTQTSTTTSGPSTRSPIGPKGSTSLTVDPIAFLIAGNLLAAIATAAALGSMRRRKQASLSSWQ